METALVVAVSYLLGSIPTSDIVARMGGIDIRRTGSGNPGFTNVLRTMGPRMAAPVLAVDIAKGVVAVLVIADLLGGGAAVGRTGVRLIAGLAAIAGHIWPVFARFRGGKGVATACGVFLALTPFATVAAVVVWTALVFGTGYVSVASIAAAALLPLAAWAEAKLTGVTGHAPVIATAGAIALVVLVRHRGNIRRLLDGTENRFGRGSDHGGDR